jgi:hypothetical protein
MTCPGNRAGRGSDRLRRVASNATMMAVPEGGFGQRLDSAGFFSSWSCFSNGIPGTPSEFRSSRNRSCNSRWASVSSATRFVTRTVLRFSRGDRRRATRSCGCALWSPRETDAVVGRCRKGFWSVAIWLVWTLAYPHRRATHLYHGDAGVSFCCFEIAHLDEAIVVARACVSGSMP